MTVSWTTALWTAEAWTFACRASALRATVLTVLTAGLLSAGCSDDGAGPDAPSIEVELLGLPALDTATAGPFEIWLIGAAGELVSAGRIAVTANPFQATLDVTLPDPAAVMVTLERPRDSAVGPSPLKIMGGPLVNGEADLRVRGYLTPNLPLEPNPGQHVLGTFWEFGPAGIPERETGEVVRKLSGPLAGRIQGRACEPNEIRGRPMRDQAAAARRSSRWNRKANALRIALSRSSRSQ